ncbi:hypothetical protein GBA52_003701 [Prunus armeniaca]|nr:hypothetical protein GBA52_003701 [Prunus armeniaca]
MANDLPSFPTSILATLPAIDVDPSMDLRMSSDISIAFGHTIAFGMSTDIFHIFHIFLGGESN